MDRPIIGGKDSFIYPNLQCTVYRAIIKLVETV